MSLLESIVGARRGEPQATADLFRVVYDDLKRLAARHLAHEHPGHTLQPTALVHEVYLRLLGGAGAASDAADGAWDGKTHFYAAAATAMRRILVESARRRQRVKRGGDRAREPLDPDQIAGPEVADELLALDAALTKLEGVEPTIAELVKLRYFGGLTLKAVAATLGLAPRTADAYWAYARAWLMDEMREPADAG